MMKTPPSDLRGSLSAYAKKKKISLNTAIKRKSRGSIVFCADYPQLVDFVRSDAATRPRGRPKKK